ncbi:MAG TPA: CAP domain-containing protein [Pyrinomonadaceae bacterium]
MRKGSLPARFILPSAAMVFAVAFVSGPAVAQESGDRPVARLISSTTIPSARPRRTAEPSNSSPGKTSNDQTFPSLEDATAIERRAFELTNEERVKTGLNRLEWDPELCYLARIHSKKMARQGFFSHITPEGQRLKDRALAMGIPRFRVIAENIAYNQGFKDPGAFAVERWMISTGHRANILYSGFQTAAVGVFVAPDGTVYLTQAFIAR